VPGPFGNAWGDTTIRGHVSRGNGILNNELYVGRLVWNRQRFVKDPSEQRVLSGLTHRLVSAEAVAEAVRAYHQEMNRQNHERRAQTDTDRRALPKIERAITGIMAAIEDGMYQPAMKTRMAELEREKSEIEARLSDARPDLPDVNPNVAEIYRRKATRLAEALADSQAGQEAASAHPLAHRRCDADTR
jgi:site-specific DNA recombinase